MIDATMDRTEAPIAAIVHLSGRRRGETERLCGERLRIGTAPGCEIRLPGDPGSPAAEHHASLHLRGSTYQLRAEPGQTVWVNGEKTQELVLASGDVLEIGEGGPILRFRMYEPGTQSHKSLAEAFADCVDCARYGGRTRFERLALFLAEALGLTAHTPLWLRGAALGLAVLLLASTALLIRRNLQIEKRLAVDDKRVVAISEVVRRTGLVPLSEDDVRRMRSDIETQFATTERRLNALEERTAGASRIISTASQSVILIQGAYGFQEPDGKKFLRFRGLGPDGSPLRDSTGDPAVGLEGEGPPLEIMFTGTAFVVGETGILLTNRHLALPWEYNDTAKLIGAQGFRPAMTRLIGYLPHREEPFELKLLLASDDEDLAVLQCIRSSDASAPPLELEPEPSKPGDEVIVLGYPAGIPALVARTDTAFMEELSKETNLDFWRIARLLAKRGHIAPLATRGIVGQVSPGHVVYDAETTVGGSGGPVLGPGGRVVAVNSAVLSQFGGANMGVPAEEARQFLTKVLTANAGAPR